MTGGDAIHNSITVDDLTINNSAYSVGGYRMGDQEALSAILTKRDLTVDAAVVTFTLTNKDGGPIFRHGFVKITAAAEDKNNNASDVAWFLYKAVSLDEPFPTSFVLVDSGGEVATFTNALSSGVLTITTTKDNLVAIVEYASTSGRVTVT